MHAFASDMAGGMFTSQKSLGINSRGLVHTMPTLSLTEIQAGSTATKHPSRSYQWLGSADTEQVFELSPPNQCGPLVRTINTVMLERRCFAWIQVLEGMIMVMRRSIDIDDTDDDYMVGSEEGGVFFSDEDLQHEQQAPTMVEVNPPRKAVTAFQIPWRALRLPGARGSERWVGSEAFYALGKALGGRADDIRSSPYAYVFPRKHGAITSTTWTVRMWLRNSVPLFPTLRRPPVSVR